MNLSVPETVQPCYSVLELCRVIISLQPLFIKKLMNSVLRQQMKPDCRQVVVAQHGFILCTDTLPGAALGMSHCLQWSER